MEVTLKTFEDSELIVSVVAAWVSKQLVRYQKVNGRVELFIALIHVVGDNGQMIIVPPDVVNLKALKFLLKDEEAKKHNDKMSLLRQKNPSASFHK